MKSNFEERRQNRKDRYEELADKNRQQSEEGYEAARDIGNRIPMGQPILVGHHSERGRRADLKRIDNNMQKSVEHSKKARCYEQKAQVVESNRTVYSDDPEAIQKLKCKLSDMQRHQEWMKAINKLCRSKKLADEQITEQLEKEYGLTDHQIISLLNPQYSWAASRYQKRGFQTWQLSNNNSNMRLVGHAASSYGLRS